jgi:hypothetical protein
MLTRIARPCRSNNHRPIWSNFRIDVESSPEYRVSHPYDCAPVSVRYLAERPRALQK